MITKTFNIGKWKIELEDTLHEATQKTMYFVKIYNTKAKKEYNSLKHYYSFRTIENREEWVMEFVNKQKSLEEWKMQRKAERKGSRKGEITYIVKKALSERFGTKNVRVNRGRGTASGWVEAWVNIERPFSGPCDDCKTSVYGYCDNCSKLIREATEQANKISFTAVKAAGESFGTWYGDDDYAKSEFLLQVNFK